MNTPTPVVPDSGYPMMDEGGNYPAPAPAFQLQKFLVFLRRYWWVPACTLALGLTAGVTGVLFSTPNYVSSAKMWETEKLRLPEGALFTEDPQNYLGTQSELMRSGRLRELALARLQATDANAVARGKEGRPLGVQVKVTQTPKSSVFVVQASSSDPAYTRAYLDSLMNEYLSYKKDIRKVVSGDTLASISEQVLRLERDLKADQDALTAFQRTNNLAVLKEEGTIAGSYLARLKTQLSDYQLETQLLEASALEQEFSGSDKTNALSLRIDAVPGSALAASQAAVNERQTAFKELELLKIQREKLSKYLRPKHPKIVKLDADIDRGQKLLEMYRAQSLDQLASARQALKMRTESVVVSIREWEGKVTDANARIAEAERLKLNVNRTQSLYDRLVGLLQNVDISRNIDQATLAILEPASAAERSFRKELQLLALLIMGGLALGLGVVALIAVKDDRFGSLVEVSEKLVDNIVGQVPEVGGRNGHAAFALLEDNEHRHVYAESYRNLRSAIHFLATDGARPKVLLITSALPEEGKSTIAVNLARTLVLGGARVVLVDGDLRKGRLHEALGLRNEPGLAEVLRQSVDLEKAIQTDTDSSLGLIARGGGVRNPGDLFLGAGFDAILQRLRERFDYVLVDSSPVFAADDATTLAPKVDGTLFVVRSRYSRARVVREALDQIHQRQAKVLGLILNRADASARSYYYYKYADYYEPEEAAAAGKH